MPLTRPIHFTYCCASSQLTSRIGEVGPAPGSCATRAQPFAVTQAFHACTVTSYLPIAKGASMTTWCAGRSLGSLALFPIMKVPAGRDTSTGQDWQSRISPLARARAAAIAGEAGLAGGGFGFAAGGLCAV